MEIPVFVSCPTTLSDKQALSRGTVMRILKRYRLEPRALGIILGFEQYRSLEGINKPGSPGEEYQRFATSFPTPWNHLEAGILFGLQLPLLDGSDIQALNDVFLKWQANVRQRYYDN